jgi:hypothetical protein
MQEAHHRLVDDQLIDPSSTMRVLKRHRKGGHLGGSPFNRLKNYVQYFISIFIFWEKENILFFYNCIKMLTYMMPIKMCMDLREGLTFKAKYTLCSISPPIIMRNSMDRSMEPKDGYGYFRFSPGYSIM